jgi:hypothetical protein
MKREKERERERERLFSKPTEQSMRIECNGDKHASLRSK